jgi:hypothetical protein
MLTAHETLETIEANKDEVIAKLKENQAKHISEYREALTAYRKVLIDHTNKFINDLVAFREKIEATEPGGELPEVPNLYFNHEPPDNHQKDYERVIGMLEMSVKDTVRVTAQQWAAYVQDDWNWKKEFLRKTIAYSRGN